MEQTAVEWVYETLWKQNDYSLPNNILEQAKEMEKQKQGYSEEDLRQAYNYGMFAVTSGRNFKDWFTNYKSK